MCMEREITAIGCRQTGPYLPTHQSDLISSVTNPRSLPLNVLFAERCATVTTEAVRTQTHASRRRAIRWSFATWQRSCEFQSRAACKSLMVLYDGICTAINLAVGPGTFCRKHIAKRTLFRTHQIGTTSVGIIWCTTPNSPGPRQLVAIWT